MRSVGVVKTVLARVRTGDQNCRTVMLSSSLSQIAQVRTAETITVKAYHLGVGLIKPFPIARVRTVKTKTVRTCHLGVGLIIKTGVRKLKVKICNRRAPNENPQPRTIRKCFEAMNGQSARVQNSRSRPADVKCSNPKVGNFQAHAAKVPQPSSHTLWRTLLCKKGAGASTPRCLAKEEG